MANNQILLRVRSDPLEFEIRVLIQILGWIWGFFLKMAHLKFVVLHDVTLCACVCVCAHTFVGNKREKKVLTAVAWYSDCIAAGASHCARSLPVQQHLFVSISQQKILWGPWEPKQMLVGA